MTTKTHYTSATTWTPPAWVTRYRAIVAGGQGLPYTDPSNQAGGLGAILSGIFPASGALTVGVGSRAGGNPGNGNGGKGGAASVVGSMVAGAGGGQGSDYYNSSGTFKRAGNAAGQPGSPGGGANYDGGDGYGGEADGSGGLGGARPGATSGAAGKSNANGGAGGNGANRNNASGGGGGGGFGGGGGGAAGNAWDGGGNYGGFGGGGGSSTFGSATDPKFVGYNSGAPWADIEIAAAPLQPTLATPTGNAYIDRTIDQPLTFQSNPASTDVLDAQTDAEVDYRLVGAPSWTTIGSLGAATTATITAGTLAIGSYEWRARTKADGGVGDAMGVWGPYSETGYFRADNPATAPTVTSPAVDDVVAVNSATAEWTVAVQTAFQMRVVGDNAGAPDPGTIYADTGEVIGTDRTKTLTVGVNHVPAHVQVRVRDKTGGVWSAWVSVAVTIEWAGPPKPRVIIATNWHQIGVTVVNPAPVGVEPVADRIEVYVIEGETRERRAILAPGDGWIYETPPSGVEIGIEAVAIYTPTNVQTSSGVTY